MQAGRRACNNTGKHWERTTRFLKKQLTIQRCLSCLLFWIPDVLRSSRLHFLFPFSRSVPQKDVRTSASPGLRTRPFDVPGTAAELAANRRIVQTKLDTVASGCGRPSYVSAATVNPEVNCGRRRRYHCSCRFAPYPATIGQTTDVTMFKWGYPMPDGGVGGRGSNTTTTSSTMLPGSIVPPPPPQINHHSSSFTTFTPSDLQQFPYTFSSISPPTYSWANTNSTDVMKYAIRALSLLFRHQQYSLFHFHFQVHWIE